MKSPLHSLKRMTAASWSLLVLALLALTYSPSSAQYKRHALMEEGTGGWCGWCPYGAYTIDSSEHIMGEAYVAISYHNGDGLAIKATDTLASVVGATGYPWATLGRKKAGSGAYTTFPNPWHTTSVSNANKAPVADFRIVNVEFNPSTRVLEFDLDVTPFNLATFAKEDTCSYATVAVITEDDLVEPQHRYASGNLKEADIEDFVHENVARMVIGKVSGDAIVLGTLTPGASYPVRKHYKVTLNAAWKQNKVQLKAFVMRKSKKAANGSEYLDAGQTDYMSTLPMAVDRAIWVVTPRKAENIDPSNAYSIVWAKGGSTGNAKLEYTFDDGATWNEITASTDKSPYAWTIPANAWEKSVKIRATDVGSAATKFITEAFNVGKAIMPEITVSKPSTGESIVGGSTYTIMFNTTGQVAQTKNLHYTTDGGASWNPITQITNDLVSFDWAVPAVVTSTAQVRVTDANNIIGLSGVFSITEAPSGSITITKPTTGDILLVGAQTQITITTSGTVGAKKRFDLSLDHGATWTPQDDLTGDGPFTWTVPNSPSEHAMLRLRDDEGITALSNVFTIAAPSVSITEVTVKGSQPFKPNGQAIIDWKFSGTLPSPVTIEWSANGMAPWTYIAKAASVSATQYIWNGIPDVNTTSARVRVSLGGDDQISAVSSPFAIQGTSSVKVGGDAVSLAIVSSWPNPAIGAEAKVRYSVPTHSQVTLRLLSIEGATLATLATGNHEIGSYEVWINTANLASGSYICQLESEGKVVTERIVVQR